MLMTIVIHKIMLVFMFHLLIYRKPLFHICLLASENLYMIGTNSWLTGVHKILSFFMNPYWQLNITGMKKNLQTVFEAFWTRSISNKIDKRCNNILWTYCKFQCNFNAENYINHIPFNKRVNYSANTLAIETGRHTRPRLNTDFVDLAN